MRTARPYYRIRATLPERGNHPFAKFVAIEDTRDGRLFVANTCDVHLRLAPWDGGQPSHYSDDEVHERLLMMKAGGWL